MPSDNGTPPEQPQHPTKDQPVGSIVHKLFWFSITAGKGNCDIEHDKLDQAAKWLDTFCVRGGKKRLLHLQMAVEIRAPPPEDKGHLAVAKTYAEMVKNYNLPTM